MQKKLFDGEIVIWDIDLDQLNQASNELWMLDPVEMARYRCFRYEADRMRFASSHVALRKILGLHLGIAPNDIRYGYSNFGKPHLVSETESWDLHFSFSHSDSKALLAVGRLGPLGIDLEKVSITNDHGLLFDHVCTTNEAVRLKGVSAQRRNAEFLRYWTAKEAYLKGTGTGLSVEPKSIEVSSDFTTVVIDAGVGDCCTSPWHLLCFDIGEEFIACLAVSRKPTSISKRVFVP